MRERRPEDLASEGAVMAEAAIRETLTEGEEISEIKRDHGCSHLEVAVLVEKLGRRYLDVMRVQLRHLGFDDLSPSQMIMLLSVGPGEVSVNDILARGGHVGSNTSHSLKQLVERRYLERNSSPRDRRLARIALTAKGRHACARFRDEDHDRSHDLDQGALVTTREVLHNLEECWIRILRFGAVLVSPCLTSSFTDTLLASSFT
jgi:DNA-binding MarR family transcriptional regulator